MLQPKKRVKKRPNTNLENAYDSTSRFDIKIILGDSKIGKEFTTIDINSLRDTTSNNDLQLINFTLAKEITISSIWFPHKSTWKSSDGCTIN